MKEEPLLLLSDLQKLINQVVLIDYTIIILEGDIMGKSKNSITLEVLKNLVGDDLFQTALEVFAGQKLSFPKKTLIQWDINKDLSYIIQTLNYIIYFQMGME